MSKAKYMRKRAVKFAPAFKTNLGKYYVGDVQQLLNGSLGAALEKKVQLIVTSPPFPLNRKKKYGNKSGDEFKDWLVKLGRQFSKLLKENGSLVIEMGNSWVPGRPVQSLLHLKSLIALAEDKEAGFRLCQQFVCYNPARLPSPAQWVTVERSRVTDSFTHIWWLAKSDLPKADNRRVLRPYSRSMLKLLENKKYNSGYRPSEHRISKEGFLRNNDGSIAHNFFELSALNPDSPPRLPNVMRIANTTATDSFLRQCRERKINPHPARMPAALANFFISFLSEHNDIVFDPFAGSNTTGTAAELLGRRWISTEINDQYLEQAKLRLTSQERRTRAA